MAVSEVSIVNDALSMLGAERIISLNDDSPTSRLFKEQYQKTRDDLLRAHPWNFAMKRATLAQSTETPAYEFPYYFVVPADCLRILEVQDGASIKWKREGQLVASDSNVMRIKYIAKITEPGLFDANFSRALAFKLAADNAFAVTQSVTLTEAMNKKAQLALAEARSFNAQEGGPATIYADDWLNSRY